MAGPTNSDRAEWARQAVETFEHAACNHGEPLIDNIKDLIVDLLHLARREGGIENFDARQFVLVRADCHDEEVDQDEEG